MVKILGVDIYQYSLDLLIVNNIKASTKKKYVNNLISATSAHGIITAQKDGSFKAILNSFYANLPDGMPVVWVGKLKGAKGMQRCYGPDFFRETIIATKNEKVNHFFCGGKEGVAEELKIVCEKKFENKNIVGTFTPPFREMTEEELKNLAEKINSLCSNIVWIGLSTPKQEIFAYRLSKYTKVNYICTVGAAFDFHTGRLRQAPKWMQNTGLEWLFRLMMEPRRLWKRYVTVIPFFIYYNVVEFLKGDFFKGKEE